MAFSVAPAAPDPQIAWIDSNGRPTVAFFEFIKRLAATNTTVTTVAALPAASSSQGQRFAVTDSNAALTAGIGAVVAAGGANVVPVYSDGSAWRLG